jgi:cytochrome c1
VRGGLESDKGTSLKEEQLNQLIAYIKSLKDEKPEFKKKE